MFYWHCDCRVIKYTAKAFKPSSRLLNKLNGMAEITGTSRTSFDKPSADGSNDCFDSRAVGETQKILQKLIVIGLI